MRLLKVYKVMKTKVVNRSPRAGGIKQDAQIFPKSLLVCSAWLPEQKIMRALFETTLNFDHASLTDIEKSVVEKWHKAASLAIESGLQVDFLLCGVGVFQALENLCLYLQNRSFDMVIFTGTAGMNPLFSVDLKVDPSKSEFEPFASLVHRVVWYDEAIAAGSAYVPAPMKEELEIVSEFDSRALVQSGDLRATDLRTTEEEGQIFPPLTLECACTTGITSVLSSCGERENLRPALENLELYGVARACKKYELPWFASLGVSNMLGEQAHMQWKKNHVLASARAQELLLKCIFTQLHQE